MPATLNFNRVRKPQADRAFGRFLGRRGAGRVVFRKIDRPLTNRERLARWRNAYAEIPLEIATGAPL